MTSRIVNCLVPTENHNTSLITQLSKFIRFILLREDTNLDNLNNFGKNWLVMEGINTSLSLFSSRLRFQGEKLVGIRSSQQYNSVKLMDTMK